MGLGKSYLVTFKGHRAIFKTVTYGEDVKLKKVSYSEDFQAYFD